MPTSSGNFDDVGDQRANRQMRLLRTKYQNGGTHEKNIVPTICIRRLLLRPPERALLHPPGRPLPMCRSADARGRRASPGRPRLQSCRRNEPRLLEARCPTGLYNLRASMTGFRARRRPAVGTPARGNPRAHSRLPFFRTELSQSLMRRERSGTLQLHFTRAKVSQYWRN